MFIKSKTLEILRFLTAGSVDDGKSTLIGRLLYDTESLYDDVLENITRNGAPDLAILSDGLKAEREQGITIDVAYKYFQTDRRKFIMADAPGHVQYTRNMITAASQADLAILLIDARQGVVEQTRRHSYLASLMGIEHIVVCVNKMDLMGYEEGVFKQIADNFKSWAAALGTLQIAVMPISALTGQGVARPADAMPWYTGPTLLEYLEQVPAQAPPVGAARLPVQYVIRPQTAEWHDFRGYAGRVQGGVLRVGHTLMVGATGRTSTAVRLHRSGKAVDQGLPGESIVVELADDLDISRGDLLADAQQPPRVTQELTATLCWLDDAPLSLGGRYLLQHHGRRVRCRVAALEHVLNIHTLQPEPAQGMTLNDIGQVQLQLAEPLAYDAYTQSKHTGAALLIDERTRATAGAVLLK